MKIPEPKDINYAAEVIRLDRFYELAGLDRLVAVRASGYQALVSRDYAAGELAILFPPEVQLAAGFARENNLHRHGDLNADPGAKGYLEDNRRVRAIRLKGHRSDALLMPMASLAYVGDVSGLKPGDVFDQLGDHEICRKYVVARRQGAGRSRAAVSSRVSERFFPRHFDTPNYFRVWAGLNLPYGSQVITTQKLHGTSVRIGHIPVARALTLRDRIARRLGVRVHDTEHALVYGSRREVKDPSAPGQMAFYSEDLYTQEGARLAASLPPNVVLYGEIIGWDMKGKAIQPRYTYAIPGGERQLYIYRGIVLSPLGHTIEIGWDILREMVTSLGGKTVVELGRSTVGGTSHADVESLLDRALHQTFPNAVPLGADSPCDEGVCLRVDGSPPIIVKAKSPMFLQHETKLMDAGHEDIEAGSEEPVPAKEA